mmetsp:Transcript_48144/g.79775  ORF Transcript_48144/g.79775 Transcript_48144/m.79775 type:complete len:179 (+) Transcript_48144:59-595(+)|eukprot:CAMPEP_0119313830 /NCGR_PEP_ID=MMETSP1333-20130426/30585_1 /TAXON_ID=418940 /ORGANISM="Scyphosphaera apsteinii, Strain RCC1455" /LENGTH=178 /DNA_ID=CAMNT_0007318789 /DNA_START=121 /DNA_END=657 /DNA_ORIENTATION=+
MPLTHDDLFEIRESCLADDVPIPHEGISWTESEAKEYFESGGKKFPRHMGLEGAETLAYYDLKKEELKQSSSTMLAALGKTLNLSSEAKEGDLAPGRRVQTHGLVKKPELNWLIGTLLTKRADGRWGVEFEDGRQVAFKPDNLRLIDEEMLAVAPRVAKPEPKGSSELYIPPTPMFTD